MKDISCFANLIGIRTPCETTPSDSGYYIHDLKGISLDFGNAIASSDYLTGKQFLQDKIDTATRIVSDSIWQEIQTYIRFKSVVEQGTIGRYSGGYSPMPEIAGIRVRKMFPFTTSNPIGIQKITLLTQSAGDYTLTINDGGLIKTTPVTLAAFVQTDLILNYLAQSDTIYITLDNEGDYFANTSTYSGCMSCGKGLVANNRTANLEVVGWDGANTSAINFYGMIPTVTLSCSEANVLCPLRNAIGLAVLYKTGGLLYGELALSARINKYTQFKKELAASMSAYYDNDDPKSPGMYQRQLKIAIQNSRNTLNSIRDECFTCNSNQYAYAHP